MSFSVFETNPNPMERWFENPQTWVRPAGVANVIDRRSRCISKAIDSNKEFFNFPSVITIELT